MKIYMAPMEGVTTYVFRNAFYKYYGGVDFYCAPFVTAQHLKGREKKDVLPANNTVPSLLPQILANDADTFTMIASQLKDLGYNEVNLNLGCPSGTVSGKGRGSGFLRFPEELDAFLDSIYKNAVTEISIKTRIGYEDANAWPGLLDIFKKYPVKTLIIHPRLRSEFYAGKVHLDAYALAVKALKGTGIGLVYNGDITDCDSYRSISGFLTATDSVMLGRGLISDPLLAFKLKGEPVSFDGKRFHNFMSEVFSDYLVDMGNERAAIMKMKELWAYHSSHTEKSVLKNVFKSKTKDEYLSAQYMAVKSINN